MKDLPRRTNRRALLAFSGVFSLLFLVGGAHMVREQIRLVLKEDQELVLHEVNLLGELALESVLRGDYASVQRLVTYWGESHPEILTIAALAPNGFVLGEYSRPLVDATPLRSAKTLAFNGRDVLHLHMARVRPELTGTIAVQAFRFALAILLLLALSAWLLWRVLRATAIIPLENEIIAHEKIERELMRRTGELEILNSELEAFSYSVSHDLRAPLRAIDGFATALSEDCAEQLDVNGQKYLARVRNAAQRMGLLIDDILGLSRVNRSEISSRNVDLSRLAREIGARLANESPDRAVEFVVRDGIAVHADEGLMRIVLDNLLENAWKYTSARAKARIEFGTELRDGETVFYVRDDGAGFDMRHVEKLFKPFQRLHAVIEYPGTGIGLATVARIIHRHGGRVWAEGEPDKGAVIYFTLGEQSNAN